MLHFPLILFQGHVFSNYGQQQRHWGLPVVQEEEKKCCGTRVETCFLAY